MGTIMWLVLGETYELERWVNYWSRIKAAQLENTPRGQSQIKTKNKNCKGFSNETDY